METPPTSAPPSPFLTLIVKQFYNLTQLEIQNM